jgi:hypothetical protein
VFSSVGPVIGGFQARYLSWQWNVSNFSRTPKPPNLKYCHFEQFWLQLIFGVFVQLLQLCTPETKASVLTTRVAKRMRAQGKEVYSNHELEARKWEPKEIAKVMARPVSLCHIFPYHGIVC